jgi:hypothetical protein
LDAGVIATDHPLDPAHRSSDDGFGVHPLFLVTMRGGDIVTGFCGKGAAAAGIALAFLSH